MTTTQPPTTRSGEPRDQVDIETLAARLDETASAVEGLDAHSRRVAETALRAHDDVHARVLTTIVRHLKQDPHGKELLFELVDDPQVRLVLLMHRILRPDPATLAGRVIDRLRPEIRSHGADVEFVRVTEGVVSIRLQVTGCSGTATGLGEQIEQALLAEVPGVTRLEVLPTSPAPTLIPLSSVRVRSAATDRDSVEPALESIKTGSETGPPTRSGRGSP
ncbi:MAG: NifU family protein [Actinomycetales bacterium]